MELAGRSALVTGGAGGLGGATVRHLIGLGMFVAIFDQNASGGAALADELGDRAVAIAGDVTEDGDVSAAVDAARDGGPLSVLVNVAGGGVRSQRIMSRDGTPHDKGAFLHTMSMNVIGTFNVTRLAAPVMAGNDPDEDGQRGVVVNTSSLAGLEGQAGQLAYASAKAAIAGMTLPMARDLAPVGIRVCTIAPGTMATPIFQSAPEELKERLVADVPFPRRMGHPEEYAFLVEMIAREFLPQRRGHTARRRSPVPSQVAIGASARQGSLTAGGRGHEEGDPRSQLVTLVVQGIWTNDRPETSIDVIINSLTDPLDERHLAVGRAPRPAGLCGAASRLCRTHDRSVE